MQPEGLQELERFLQAFSLRGIMKTPISQGVALGCVLRPRWGRCGSGGASVFCRWSRNRGCPLVVLHIFLMGIRLTRTATLTVDDWKRLAGAPQGCLPSAEGDGDRPVLRSFSEAGLWAFRCPRTRGTRKMRVQTASSAALPQAPLGTHPRCLRQRRDRGRINAQFPREMPTMPRTPARKKTAQECVEQRGLPPGPSPCALRRLQERGTCL